MSAIDSTSTVRYGTIPSRPGFRFGDDGSIETAWTMGVRPKLGDEWRALKASPRPNGYCWIYLGSRKGNKPLRVDEVVCEAFHGPRPPGMECLHRDGDRTNCRSENLYWGVAQNNLRDASIEYRTIDRCDGYDFGADGSVWTYWGTGFTRPGDIPRRMNPTPLDSGHLQVTVRWDGVMRRFGVHVLIATAFHGECPDGMECCHRDGIPDNNASPNLYWGTRRKNIQDQIDHGVLPRGEYRWNAKLTDSDVSNARRRYAAGESAYAMAKEYGISAEAMTNAISGKTWSHVSGAVPIRQDHGRKMSDPEIVRARQLYAAGATSSELATLFNVSVQLILRVVRGEIGGDLPGAMEIRPARKLTDEQEAEVCRLAFEDKVPIGMIADQFGIHKQTAYNILARHV